uniref:LysR family transcriptional regulator n=1 Tax=Frankia sp. Cr1 TaxID=3073931 RepID=UPI002AD533B8
SVALWMAIVSIHGWGPEIFMELELRHLRYFLAVAEKKNFTRAAAALCVSQPTLSEQIRALEREAGTRLFTRRPGGTDLTPAGAAMIAPAQSALQAARDALQTARDIGASRLSRLRVGVVPGACSQFIAAFAAAYRTAFPDCELTLCEVTYFDAPEDLVQGRIDVMLTRLPLDAERFCWHELVKEPVELFIGPHHPLAMCTALPVEEVLDVPILRGPPNAEPWMMDYWLLTRYRNGEPPRVAGEGATRVSEFAYQVTAGNGSATGTASMRRAVGVRQTDLPSVLLLGVEPNAAVAAQRRNDPRPEVRAFCLSAVQVCKALAALPDGLPDRSAD